MGPGPADNGFHVMAYDVPGRLPYEPGVNPVFVSVRGTDADEITAYWKGLSRRRHDRAGARPRRVVSALRHAPGPVRRGLGARRRRGADRAPNRADLHNRARTVHPQTTARGLWVPQSPQPVGRTGHATTDEVAS